MFPKNLSTKSDAFSSLFRVKYLVYLMENAPAEKQKSLARFTGARIDAYRKTVMIGQKVEGNTEQLRSERNY